MPAWLGAIFNVDNPLSQGHSSIRSKSRDIPKGELALNAMEQELKIVTFKLDERRVEVLRSALVV